jgi:hypothetical protein
VKSRLALIAALALGLGLQLTACSTPKIWPFYKKPKPAPEAVHEVDLVNADGTPASYPQYWKRNTLVIDLSGVSNAGTVAARLPDQTTWPVRVALRVRPGSVEQVEVQGEERAVLEVSREGTLPLDLELAPSVYRKTTAAIYISWGSMPQFAEVAAPATPGYVSPQQMPATVPAPGTPAPAAEPANPSASEIIPPAEAVPATPQPSPPPGN